MPPPPDNRPLALFYLLVIVAAAAAFLGIREVGTGLSAPAVETALASGAPVAVSLSNVPSPAAPRVDVVLHVLATLATIIAAGNLLSRLFRRVGQPAVIGEVMAGIALGPSLLGAISPEAMHWLIPGPDADPQGQVLAALKAIAQLGVVFYMFLVGLEINPRKVGKQARAAIAISHSSIVLPMILGSAMAIWLYPILSSSDVPFTSFSLFMGVAMSITAFPVLARILTDRQLERTDLGVVALSCAAADDVTAWCLLAFVVGVAKAQVGGALVVIGSAMAFIAAMCFVVRPLITRWIARVDAGSAETRGVGRAAMPLVFIGVLCAALTTEAIGIHAVFGSFVLGALFPHDSTIAHELRRKLNDIVTILLLPAFFAVTGMNTRIGLIEGWDNWLICLAIIAVATIGKFGGSLVAARVSGLEWRTSAALGVLMNTRGLMELIVLNIGLAMGVISEKLFAMMVIMAVVTTLLTSPILSLLVPTPRHAEMDG